MMSDFLYANLSEKSDCNEVDYTLYRVISKKLLKNFYNLWLGNKLCDVCLVIDNTRRFIHKMILITHSSHFAYLTNTKPKDMIKIVLFRSTIEGLDYLISYMYTIESNIDSNNFAQLLISASELKIEKLYEECQRYIIRLLNNDSIDAINQITVQLSILRRAKNENIYLTIINYLTKNLQILIQSANFFKIAYKILRDILECEKRSFEHEIELLFAVIKWLEIHKKSKKITSWIELLESICFHKIRPTDYDFILEKCELVLNKMECKNEIIDYVQYV
jgi:hypothetical protein